MTETPEIPDLKSLLAEASRPSASVTVPLKQGLADRIRQAEAELSELAAKSPSKRMGSKSPVKEKAEEVEALRSEMAASALTFHFEALTDPDRERIRRDMGGRDEPDEVNLRATAVMCRRVVAADGNEFPSSMTWTDFRDLRDRIGVAVYEATIDDAANRASGAAGWSVPFSSAASLILETER